MDRIKVVFIVNPIAGTSNKKNIVRMIPKYLSADKFDFEIRYTDHRGHAAEIATECVSNSIDVVVAVGGDGTVNEVARSLSNSNTALGIIPCGSGNGLARHLNIPMNPLGALKVIANCHIERLDYGMINDTPFFCTCGVGFDAFVSSRFAESGKRGLMTYIENTLKEGINYQSEVYDIEIDGEKMHYKAFLIACANASQYGNNFYIAPHASMSDGLMDVTIMEPFSLLEAPQIAFQLFNKTIAQNSHIKTFRCKSIIIHRKQEGVIHFDGDPKNESADLNVRLIPHAISMVVNDDERSVQPPLLRTFTDLYNDVNHQFGNLKRDIHDSQKKIRSVNQELLRKLKKQRQ